MQKISRIIFWLLLLCAGCFLVAWNVRSMLPDHSSGVIEIVPNEIVFHEPVTE